MNVSITDSNIRWRRPADERGEDVVRAADHPGNRMRNHRWRQATRADACRYVVGEADGKIVGRAVLEAVYPPFAELQNMHVLDPYRGRGVGGAIVDECVARAGRLGFMALFLQTHADYLPAQRLYARKGFVLAGKAGMLRLVRFLNLPVLDTFLHEHPLATYSASAGEGTGEWSLAWSDWASGDRLELTLTGGTSDKDSEGHGPGVRALSLKAGEAGLNAQLDGPREAAKGTTVELRLEARNEGPDPLRLCTRLLLPPGCEAQGEWSRHGPVVDLEPGKETCVLAEIALTDDLDAEPLVYAAFGSLPLSVEVFLGRTSFWLTHTVLPGHWEDGMLHQD